MSVIKRLIEVFRSGAADLLSDKGGLPGLEGELQELQSNLLTVKQELTDVMSRQMQSSRHMVTLKMQIEEHEQSARAALDANDEAQALEVAEKIAGLDDDLEEQQQMHEVLSRHVGRLKAMANKTERHISDYERQLTMVKTTESIQRASEAIAKNYASSSTRIRSARDSLEQIRQRQQRSLDLIEAAEEVDAATRQKSLTEALEAAGITDEKASARAILDRIKSDRQA